MKKEDLIHKFLVPLHLGFHFKDFVQVLVGSAILAIPVGFTEETWNLGNELPLLNVFGFLLISLFFVGIFTYYTYYRKKFITHSYEFFKRVFLTYSISFIVVGTLLVFIDKAPWFTDNVLALKRTIIVTFPATMSGAVVDSIR